MSKFVTFQARHFNFSLYHDTPLQICDMVAIARYLNITLIVPELDKTSFWADARCFGLP